ncbi:MAG TPA: hypothetical protein VFI96_04950, partial [Longimicrobiaceae bacterium]|nr:hypothetical protein [Longimicrobiaceae bacterium]
MKIQWMVPVLLATALVGACGDNPSGGRNPSDLRLEIRSSGVLSEEETLAVGDTLQLSAELLNPNGTTAESGTLDWRTTDSTVAQIRVRADQSVDVAGRSVGVALVIASSGKYSDTTRIDVVEPVSSALECAPGDPGLALSTVGEA